MTSARMILMLFVAMLGMASASDALAKPCGLSGNAIAAQTITYDPFAPAGLQSIDVTLNLTRDTGPGNGAKTQQAYFVLTQPVGSPAYQVQALASGTTYTNVSYYDNNVPSGLPVIGNTSGQIGYNFGGTSQPDTVPIQLRVTVPPFTNIVAGNPIKFNVRYVCQGTGGMSDVTTPTTINDAITINVNVISALRASFAGGLVGATPALAFGEVGNDAAGGRLTPANNYVRVQANAPYKVNLTSANNFYMTVNGTANSNTNQKIGYNLKFLGVTKTAGTVGGIANKQCNHPGVGDSLEDKLYIQAQLAEGGTGKAPSGNYFDTLTVTIEPLAIGTADPGFVCGGATNGQF